MKTLDPCWNEFFIKEVENGKMVGLTVFHETTLPPDDFVANCSIFFTDLANRGTEQQDFWVGFLGAQSLLWLHFTDIFRCAAIV